MLKVISIVETVAGVTYTGQTSIPAGARVMDAYLETTSAWTAGTAPCDVGDSDAVDALAAAVDIAGVGITDGATGAGTDWGNGLTAVNGPISALGAGKLYLNDDTVTAVVSPTVPGGPTGASRVILWVELDTTIHDALVV